MKGSDIARFWTLRSRVMNASKRTTRKGTVSQTVGRDGLGRCARRQVFLEVVAGAGPHVNVGVEHTL